MTNDDDADSASELSAIFSNLNLHLSELTASDFDLSKAVSDLDFNKMKREVARNALRPRKSPKMVAPELEALVERQAIRAAEAAGGRSGMVAVRAARNRLTRQLEHRRVPPPTVRAAIARFDARWAEIFVGPAAARLRERMKRWADG